MMAMNPLAAYDQKIAIGTYRPASLTSSATVLRSLISCYDLGIGEITNDRLEDKNLFGKHLLCALASEPTSE